MGHTPFGYRIEDGKAVVDDKAAEQVKELFSGYLSGLSLKNAAIKAGIDCYHATVSRMLLNKQYLETNSILQLLMRRYLKSKVRKTKASRKTWTDMGA